METADVFLNLRTQSTEWARPGASRVVDPDPDENPVPCDRHTTGDFVIVFAFAERFAPQVSKNVELGALRRKR